MSDNEVERRTLSAISKLMSAYGGGTEAMLLKKELGEDT